MRAQWHKVTWIHACGKTKTMCTGRILKAPHNEAALWETEMLASAKKCAISVPFLRFVRFFTDFWLVFLKVSLCALSSSIWPTIWGFNFGAEGPGRPRSWEPSEFQRLFVASACDSLYKTRVLLMPGAICKFQHRSARIYDIYIYIPYILYIRVYIFTFIYSYVIHINHTLLQYIYIHHLNYQLYPSWLSSLCLYLNFKPPFLRR